MPFLACPWRCRTRHDDDPRAPPVYGRRRRARRGTKPCPGDNPTAVRFFHAAGTPHARTAPPRRRQTATGRAARTGASTAPPRDPPASLRAAPLRLKTSPVGCLTCPSCPGDDAPTVRAVRMCRHLAGAAAAGSASRRYIRRGPEPSATAPPPPPSEAPPHQLPSRAKLSIAGDELAAVAPILFDSPSL